MRKQDEKALGGKIGVAVDLGSTTIAVSCLNLASKEEILSFSFANPQCRYGADVITRIKYCVEQPDMLEKLGEMVWDALFQTLKNSLDAECGRITHIIISGNTLMQHILRGLPVNGLAVAPFEPVDLGYFEEEVLINWDRCKRVYVTQKAEDMEDNRCIVTYPPGFSAYVGADILTGAQYLKLGQQEKYELLIDLGTNGEMLLMNNKQGLAASTACGPVFDHVLSGAKYGSESIHAISNCVKRHLIDRSGKITEPFFEKGIVIDKNFVIRQENVRNFQLAKGAVFAGIQCLMKKAGIGSGDIEKVYISGGLGFYMDVKDAFAVRMLPESFKGKVTVAGNSSLNGAKELLLKGMSCDKVLDTMENGHGKEGILSDYEALCERTKSFELSNLPEFQSIYIKALDF
ncbi:MAG: ASKHA domain-containing protein [Lachnospiraceae bacterium]|nr:ASKHA domain-containing protein [Lachnospiraceae bacterium]